MALKAAKKYLDNALPWDHIDSARYALWNKAVGHLDQLRTDSAARVTSSKEFQKIISDVHQCPETTR